MTVAISKVSFEHYYSPLGVSHPTPRISWSFEGDAKHWTQVAYEIRIVRAGHTETFRRDTDRSVLVDWPSKALSSREHAEVHVRVEGSDGKKTEWFQTSVEAALLSRSDWSAKLITLPHLRDTKPKETSAPGDDDDPCRDGPGESLKPFRLRSSFSVNSTPGQARLYVTACGIHYTYVNGKIVSPDLLEPGWSSYHDHLNYRVYNVTDLIQSGDNVLASWVGEGWFAGRLGWGQGVREMWGNKIGLIAQLEIDGKVVKTTAETEHWTWSYGATEFGEIYDGEKYDTRIDDSEWMVNMLSEQDWQRAVELPLPSAELLTTETPPVRAYAELQPKEIFKTPLGKTVIDFGQNLAGWVRLNRLPTGKEVEGTELVLRGAEVLEHKELGTRPLRNARAVDRIVLGGPSRIWEPRFTFHGFRYLQVEGWDDIKAEDVTSIGIASDMAITGTFDCSHAEISRLHQNVVWSARSNTISVPTDCPQRDERLGWTGDLQVFAPAMTYLFDAAGFLRSWLRDLRADQKRHNNIVPMVVPEVSWLANVPMAQAVWGDVAVILPDQLHIAYDDNEILAESYESIAAWLDKGIQRDESTRLWTPLGFQLADWLAPSAKPDSPTVGPTDNFLVADAYLVHVTRIAACIARRIGNKEEADKRDAEAKELLDQFHRLYVTRGDKIVSQSQTAIALMLVFDLIDPCRPKQREILVKKLEQLVVQGKWQVETGFVGTPIILQALARNGLEHHAYRMLLARRCPSWLYAVLNGATTIWERWDSMLEDQTINAGTMTSFNHYALGAVAAFMHETIGGLTPLTPGWRKISIRPRPNANLTWCKASHQSAYGRIACEWTIEKGILDVLVEVPPNSTAMLVLPGQSRESVELGSGRHHFRQEWNSDERWPPQDPSPLAKPNDDWVR